MKRALGLLVFSIVGIELFRIGKRSIKEGLV